VGVVFVCVWGAGGERLRGVYVCVCECGVCVGGEAGLVVFSVFECVCLCARVWCHVGWGGRVGRAVVRLRRGATRRASPPPIKRGR